MGTALVGAPEGDRLRAGGSEESGGLGLLWGQLRGPGGETGFGKRRGWLRGPCVRRGRCGALLGCGGSRDGAGLCGPAGSARGPGYAGAARCGERCWVTRLPAAAGRRAAGAGSARQPQQCLLGLQNVDSPVVHLRFFGVVFTLQLPVSPARICCMCPYSVCPLLRCQY